MKNSAPRMLFAAGPGNIIEAHQNWCKGSDDLGQMSLTFSGEFESFCRDRGCAAYLISSRSPPALVVDGPVILEHRPRTLGGGLLFHLGQVKYGLGILRSAVAFRANYAVIQSGTTHHFVLCLFALFSIKVIPVLHNTLWPAGFRPRSFGRRVILGLDAAFFRWAAACTICVSPECARQIEELTSGNHGPIVEMRPQFRRALFPLRRPPPALPFRLLFAGRITADKGVFDLLEIMIQVNRRLGNAVTLEICGDGPEIDALRARCAEMQLGETVTINGRVEPEMLRELLIASHAAIVPTTSHFAEGLAMTAVEPVLLGRPVITNPVVPALEILRGACISAKTDDVSSYAEAIIALVQSPELYESLTTSCSSLREMFFDRKNSFQRALEKAIAGIAPIIECP